MSTEKEKIAADLKKSAESVRKFCLSYPDTAEDHPWGESAFKVKKKTFLFMSLDSRGWRLSFKLNESLFNVLALPFCEPTGYNLGKSGWVTASFEPGDKIPIDRIHTWINESFRQVAPKTLLKTLSASPPVGAKVTLKKSGASPPVGAKVTLKKSGASPPAGAKVTLKKSDASPPTGTKVTKKKTS